MRKIALINQKGGVGKTTTTCNLGAALARAGKRVVLVDLDPQANLSLHLGHVVQEGQASSYRVLTSQASFAEAIVPTTHEGLSLVPTDIHLSGAEMELAAALGRETLLRDAVDEWVREVLLASGEEPVDYMLFDCPPSLGLLSINAMAAADEAFLVVQTEFFALQGMSKLLEVIELVTKRMNPTLACTGIVACLYDSRLRLAREVLGELRGFFPDKVFAQTISQNVKLAESPSFGQTIFQYAPDSVGARDYAGLAQAVIAMEPGAAPETVTATTATEAASAVGEPTPTASAPDPIQPAPQPDPDDGEESAHPGPDYQPTELEPIELKPFRPPEESSPSEERPPEAREA